MRLTGVELTSLISFVVKGASALIVAFLLANTLKPDDFALWAATFSWGVMLSVADLGVGQLVLTTVHERGLTDARERRLLTNAVAAMLIAGASLFLVAVGVSSIHPLLEGVRGRYVLFGMIALRLVGIPYGAVLSAQSRFHERKAMEAGSYVAGALFIGWCTWASASLSVMLLGMNGLLTLASVGIAIRATALGAGRLDWTATSAAGIGEVVAGSWVYFVSNLSGLAIYGGFVALSAAVLSPKETARLSLLHSLIFMHVFQVFDLLFRTVQVRMRDPVLIGGLKGLVGLSYVGVVLVVAFSGVRVLKHFFGKYTFSASELAVYTTFAFAEVYYLLLTARMQMESASKGKLQVMAVAKAAGFVVVLVVASLRREGPSVLRYAIMMATYSLLLAAWGGRYDAGLFRAFSRARVES